MIDHGLSSRQMAIIHDVLAPYGQRIRQVGVFGSRATGKARANSDVDLVLYGDVDEPTLDRIRTLFGESALAITVDVNAYGLISHGPLKQHIDAVMQPLFTRDELLTRRKETQ